MPARPEDVAEVLRLAQRDHIPVTCRGGGLTTEGESVSGAGILLDVKGMNRLIDCDGATAWVEAGMTWFEVAAALRPRGLDYTSAPLNLLSTVGGTLGVGGIDVNSPRHGCAADQAVELEVVTPTGEIVRVKEGDDYLERVLFGYGQFGVITKARIKVRPYRPMTVRHFLYTDVGVALADMMRLVEQDAVEACAILTLRDDVVALIWASRGSRKSSRCGTRSELPSTRRWRRVRRASLALARCRLPAAAQADLLPALHDPLFVRDGLVHDRAVVFSRLIWRHWGGPRVVIPDLAITMANFEAAARRGIDVCKRYFPYFTLYAVMIRKFGNRPRYEMSAIPATGDAHVCGIEFSPLLEGADYSPDHFQRFKNAIYDVGLELGGSYYRFGGVMKPYIRRMFGDEMVDRHRAMKQAARSGLHPQSRRRLRCAGGGMSELNFGDCIGCGLCILGCPAYEETGFDVLTARGRNKALQAGLGGAGDGRIDLGLHALRLLRRDLSERRPQRRDRAASAARAGGSGDRPTRSCCQRSPTPAPSGAALVARLHDSRARAAPHPVHPRVPETDRPPVGPTDDRLLRLARRGGGARAPGTARAGVVADPVCLEQYDAEFLGVLAMQHLELFDLEPPFYYYAPHRLVNRDHARIYPLYDALRRRFDCDMNFDLNRLARSTSAGSVQGLSGRNARDISAAVARLLEHSRAERIVTCSPADYLAFKAYSGRETRFITECLR